MASRWSAGSTHLELSPCRSSAETYRQGHLVFLSVFNCQRRELCSSSSAETAQTQTASTTRHWARGQLVCKTHRRASTVVQSGRLQRLRSSLPKADGLLRSAVTIRIVGEMLFSAVDPDLTMPLVIGHHAGPRCSLVIWVFGHQIIDARDNSPCSAGTTQGNLGRGGSSSTRLGTPCTIQVT